MHAKDFRIDQVQLWKFLDEAVKPMTPEELARVAGGRDSPNCYSSGHAGGKQIDS